MLAVDAVTIAAGTRYRRICCLCGAFLFEWHGALGARHAYACHCERCGYYPVVLVDEGGQYVVLPGPERVELGTVSWPRRGWR